MKKIFIIISSMLAINANSNAQSERVVLIEQFSNSGCPPCATYSTQVTNYVSSNIDKVIAITYHTSFPYFDSLNIENKIDVSKRVSYYDVQSVPYSIVDGNYFQGSSASLVPSINNKITARSAVNEQYVVSSIGAVAYQNNQLTGQFVVKSLSNQANNNLKVFVAVIENTVLKSSYAASPGANSETEYKYAMRKLLPNADGMILQNTNTNNTDTISIKWTISKVKKVTEMRVIVFVQNVLTKEILQASMFTPQSGIATSINEGLSKKNSISVYPNPTTGSVFIKITESNQITTVKISDIAGRTVLTDSIPANATEKEIKTEQLNTGVYIINVIGAENKSIKLVIK